MKGRAFVSDGMIELKVEKRAKRWWRRNKNGILYGSLIAPIALSLLFIDVFAKHPRVALAYLIGTGAWYTLFAFAQGRKKLRRPVRSRKPSHTHVKDFRVYDITSLAEMSKEDIA